MDQHVSLNRDPSEAVSGCDCGSGLNSATGNFYSRRQDGAAIGNCLAETSVHNLSAETSHQKEL